jgi:hypothetical protein
MKGMVTWQASYGIFDLIGPQTNRAFIIVFIIVVVFVIVVVMVVFDYPFRTRMQSFPSGTPWGWWWWLIWWSVLLGLGQCSPNRTITNLIGYAFWNHNRYEGSASMKGIVANYSNRRTDNHAFHISGHFSPSPSAVVSIGNHDARLTGYVRCWLN